ncbi:GNAT family N-acetyltransferase [Neiella marina]|uniref:GNAT family N-acetyltransferase n=1 Tax=Neiella holothuriorum TaxID=2870530 RepID=A0ABS7EFY4_9GAMM|nr:GNAT family N-acetyltransferase [Neiella holothuriorum]MBW8191175.1 GNAT family N-acetyltransferase [Neiella holothuriorum]
MSLKYRINSPVTVGQFLHLLHESELANRRPVNDLSCMQGMLKHSNLIVSAWDNEELVGIARSMTDFHYACYLSDLAVSKAYQGHLIGYNLQVLTQQQLGENCKLILLAAPGLDDYYASIGYQKHDNCWVLPRAESLSQRGYSPSVKQLR